jgi:hypothetical protein
VTGWERSLVVAALDCLGVGNQAEATEILLEALEPVRRLPPVCDVCGARAWPGDEWRHIWSRHHRRVAA